MFLCLQGTFLLFSLKRWGFLCEKVSKDSFYCSENLFFSCLFLVKFKARIQSLFLKAGIYIIKAAVCLFVCLNFEKC